MKFAIVGTGFVADYYMATLANHRQIELAGAWDRSAENLSRFCAHHGTQRFASLDSLLSDPSVTIVANLTTPESHHAVSMAALAAGKHVYSEKPLALSLHHAEDLAGEALRRGLGLASAPATVWSDALDLVRQTLASGAIGAPRLVYAEMEDGPVFRENWRGWRSASGAPWPGAHEFEIGCTLEHAGYALAWLVELLGPAVRMQAFSATAFPDKGIGKATGPDFSSGCITFESGAVARVTCGLAAPRDRSLTILGDGGTLIVDDLWDNRSAVRLSRAGDRRSLPARILRRIEARLGRVLPWTMSEGTVLPYPAATRRQLLPPYPSQIDFAAGIARLADAIAADDDLGHFAERSLHLARLTLALHEGGGLADVSRTAPGPMPEVVR